MKALFFKEIRQGKMILLFGLCFGLLLLLLAGVLGFLFLHWSWEDVFIYLFVVPEGTYGDMAGPLLVVGAGGTLLIALLSGAGLFAGEIDRGTLSLMLSLPISRKRIWGSKVIAGLVLGLLASGLLLLVLLLLQINQHLSPGDLNQIALAWTCCWFAVFCISLFFSTLMEHTVGVILAALLTCVGLGVLAGYTLIWWGGGLLGLGNDPISDIGLWLLTLTPAILLASLVAFRRGELLRGAGKWLLALPVFLLIAAASVLLLVGGVRWAVRYSRPLVEVTYPAESDWNPRGIALFALRSPAGALFLPLPQEQDNWRTLSPKNEAYRSRNLVLLNLADGREQKVITNGLTAAFSADGKKAAVLRPPQGLTWWEDIFPFTRRRIAVFDLAAKKTIADFALENQWGRYYANQIFLSPGGSWLAYRAWQEQAPHGELVVSDTAGNKIRQIDLFKLGVWTWDPEEKGIYSFDASGRLVYSPLPSGPSKILWSGQETLHMSIFGEQMILSPDGRWLALKLQGRVPEPGGSDTPRQYRYKLWVYIISADGRQAYALLPVESSSEKERLAASRLVWSADSSRLCYFSGRVTAVSEQVLHQRRDMNQAERVRVTAVRSEQVLHQWRPGEPPVLSKLPPGVGNGEIVFRPDHDDLLIWSRQGILLADRLGKQTAPAPKVSALAKQHDLLGLDQTGRAIVLQLPLGNHNHVGAVDLTTGELKQLYP